MNKIPATQPGHLNHFGLLNHPKSANGPRKGGNAYQLKKRIKEQKVELNWKVKGK